MPLGVTVTSREAPPARGAETDISPWHVVGLATSGPTDAYTELHSLADFEAVYGVRAAGNQLVYDSIDAHFREGGSKVYFVRAADNASYDDALALLPDVPGQVSIIDPTPSQVHWDLLNAHVQDYNKRAIYDQADATSVTTLVADGADLPADHLGAGFGPWVNIPGVGGSTRAVPASPIIAALCARADRTGNPNKAAGGRRFGLQYVRSLRATWTMAEVETLHTAGWNSMAEVYHVLENYGFDTPVWDTDEVFGQFNASRLEMYLIAQAHAIGENFYMEVIDGEGHTAADLQSDLAAMALEVYRVGGLFGASTSEAFQVDVSTVNDPNTAAAGRLIAVLSVKPSQHAREVNINLVSVPVNVAI